MTGEQPLAGRTRERLEAYDRADKDNYAFDDSGDARAWAEDFAGLLREWLEAGARGA